MKVTQLIQAIGGCAVASLLAGACTTQVVDETIIEPTDEITQQATTSGCGGFSQPRDAGDEPAYCDAEVLAWSYDAAQQELTLTDRRMELNCCGVHGMSIVQQGDVYVVTETDAPEIYEGTEARCSCMCVYDFALEAQGIPEQVIQLKLERDVTDGGQGVQTLFEGALDLTAGSGFEILDDTPSMWCEIDSEPAPS